MKRERQVCAFQQFEKEWAELSSVLSSLGTKEEVAQFLREICTTKECVDFAKRWALMKELLSGVPQRTIARNLQTSLCKITRGVQYCKSEESILRRCAEECIRRANEKTKEGVSVLQLADRIIVGGEISRAEMLDVLQHASRTLLHNAAARVTAAFRKETFDFCCIVNARSGHCPEDCKWCAQSAHWHADIQCFPWIGTEACVRAAKKAEATGVHRIGIVTSGKGQTPEDVDAICEAVRAIRRSTSVRVCGSLGLLDEVSLRKLYDAGMDRLHCNIEAAPALFGSLCSTHTQEQKRKTLEAARRVGMSICCGGIIGMGETDEQLVDFAFFLKEIGSPSIPVNILHPIPGTPLEKQPLIPAERIFDAIAILRLVHPKARLRFAGGRARLSDAEAAYAIKIGIDAGIAGPMLTTPGPRYQDDRHLAEQAGYTIP